MSQADEKIVEFGPFRLDRAGRLLMKGGKPVAMRDRALEILLVLVAHAPEVVSKAALFEQVWPGTFVEESTLRFQMSTLRKALGDGEGDNRYITTASGRGYCFVAPLSRAPRAVPVQAAKADTVMKPQNTNLPLRLTEIIGREAELAELEEWLKLSRLVTLVGPGGVGKTRLAMELGWRRLPAFEAGVWLVDMAPLGSADAVTNSLAGTLGISVMRTEAAGIRSSRHLPASAYC